MYINRFNIFFIQSSIYVSFCAPYRVIHPTQKPIELGRYLIRTYSNPGDLILDNTFGSGSFLVAALLEGRNFVGIEKNKNVELFKTSSIDFIDEAEKRLRDAWTQMDSNSKATIVHTNIIEIFENEQN